MNNILFVGVIQIIRANALVLTNIVYLFHDAMLVATLTTGQPKSLQAAEMLVGRCDVILTKPGQTECVRHTLVATRASTGRC